MKHRLFFPLAVAAVLIACSSTAFTQQETASGENNEKKAELQGTVDKAAVAVREFRGQEDVEALLARASGVIIYPNILKGAFVFGGEGGTGVLLSRSDEGGWSSPAFITYGAASFGLQAGVESATVLMIIMNDKTLQRFANGEVELGAGISVAAGQGVKGKPLTTDKLSDVYYFARAKGAFAGLDLKGGVNQPRNGLNADYYGEEASTPAIVIDRTITTDDAEALQEALSS
jgi:lipid-binding SYLF domain-containing protein